MCEMTKFLSPSKVKVNDAPKIVKKMDTAVDIDIISDLITIVSGSMASR